ncbi:MAG: HAD family hydrolase [Chloroflexi bacterium]|nr:HAD family hydrolase [Chloroflexota bacterium]
MLDLGDTLWHTVKPSAEVWQELLSESGVNLLLEQVRLAVGRATQGFATPHFEAFETCGVPTEQSVIDEFWREYDSKVLGYLGVKLDMEAFVPKASARFWQSGALFPETREVLDWLRVNGYRIAMVSNGIDQHQIVRSHAIDGYFEAMIRSAHVGFRKPMPEIYHLALSTLGIGPEQAVMVGDDWNNDVVGAEAVGIKALHLNRGVAPSPGPQAIKDLWGVVQFLSERK